MRWMILLSLLLGISGIANAAESGRNRAGQTIVIQAGRLLAIPGQPALSGRTLVIRGNRIVAIHEGILGAEVAGADPATAVEVIDLSDRFVLPGLMDAHVHLMWSSADLPPKKAEQMTNEDLTLWTLRNARTMLAAGFTTVREQASSPRPVFTVRDWINAGRYLGPRILAAGNPIAAHGGHGDMTRETTDPGDITASGLCSGVETCRRAVRLQKKFGADVIKMMATGGFHDATGTEQLFSFPRRCRRPSKRRTSSA